MKGRKTKSEFHFCPSCLSCRCRPRRWSPSRVNHNTCSLKPLRSIFASVSRALFGLLCSTVFLLTPLFSLLLPVIKSLHDRREVEWRPLPKRRFQFFVCQKTFFSTKVHWKERMVQCHAKAQQQGKGLLFKVQKTLTTTSLFKGQPPSSLEL